MKNLTKILLGAIAVSAIATSASAQGTVTSPSASVGITVIQPITITKTADLQFGRVIRGAGSISVAADNTVTTDLQTPGTPGARTAASFTVKAEGGQALAWTIPTTVTLTGPGSGNTLTVNTIAGTPVTTAQSLGTEQTYTRAVGGTVAIAANQASGEYTGTLAITVAYQ